MKWKLKQIQSLKSISPDSVQQLRYILVICILVNNQKNIFGFFFFFSGGGFDVVRD